MLGTAAVSSVLAYATGVAAVRRGDARVLFVSLAFLSSAGFLGLHALATPGVLLDAPNQGFAVATPVGLALGSVMAAWSTVDLTGERAVEAVRVGRWVRVAILGLMALWAVLSLAHLPPLAGAVANAESLSVALAVPGMLLYGYAAARYLLLWRRRGSTMLVAMMAAFLLLAESLAAIALARNWHLSWWEWHVLMLAAFGLVALGAQMSWHEERFADLYLHDTVAGNRDVSVLFADLQGFTTYCEAHRPEEVTAMLNAYFSVAVPAVVSTHGGDVDRIIGDALMVTFNKRGDQHDHAVRAAAAGLAMQEATASGRGAARGLAEVPGRHQQRSGDGQRARHRGRPHAHRHRRHGEHRLADRGQGTGRWGRDQRHDPGRPAGGGDGTAREPGAQGQGRAGGDVPAARPVRGQRLKPCERRLRPPLRGSPRRGARACAR